MMFNCIKHGWTSFEKPCSICNPVITFSSNSATGAIIGVSGSSWSELHEQIEFLKAENARYREALEFYAQNPKRENGTEFSNSVEEFGKLIGDDLFCVTWEPMLDLGQCAREALKGGG